MLDDAADENADKKRVEVDDLDDALSQGTFAEKIGATPQWISQLERGTASPTVHTLCKVANALDVTLSERFGDKDRR